MKMCWNRCLLATSALVVLFRGAFVFAQPVPGEWQSNAINNHEILAAKFKAGETNLPLLRLSFLQGGVRTYWVEKSGKPLRAATGISNWTDWGSPTLATSNLVYLAQAINALPAKAETGIPLRRQVHVSGIRSNAWFHFVYNVDDLPKEQLRAIFEIIGFPYPEPARAPERAKTDSNGRGENVRIKHP